MSENKKPRGDAKLKTLPEERQREIIGKLQEPEQTLKTVRAWLREDGIETSETALSYFRDWWLLQESMRRRESTVLQVLEKAKSEDSSLSQGQLDTFGNLFFSALAIEEKDSLMWKRTKDAQTKAEIVRQNEIKLQRESCELFLKWIEDKRAKEIATGGSTNADKIEQLGALMFGEGWK
jgi:hypothetical protein